MKTKKTIINYITDVIPLILITFIGLFKSKYLIICVAENQVGLYQLFSQLLGYVTIFESGMTGALLYRFFEPVANKNYKKINVLYYTGNYVFRWIAVIMSVVSLTFSFCIPFLIKDNPFDLKYIILCFMMYVSTNIIHYLISSSKVLLEAEERKHITNIVTQTFDILKSIVELIVIITTKNLIVILSVGIITTTISSIILVIICKKKNPYLSKPKRKDFEMLSDIKNLFVHKVAYLVNNNIDLIIVTKFIGLSGVVIYSSYNFIINSLKKIVTRIYVSVVPSLGNLLVENRKKSIDTFYELNEIIHFISIVVCSSLFFSIDPFIKIWYEGKINTSIFIAIGFTLILYISTSIQPLLAFTDASGIFKETKKSAVLEAIINLSLSLIFLRPFGVFGILLATFIGYFVSDSIIRSKTICVKVLNISPTNYYKDIAKFFAFFISLVFAEYFIIFNLTINSIFGWLIFSIILFVANSILTFIFFKVINKNMFLNRIKKIKKGV